jgi:hypothetical protein
MKATTTIVLSWEEVQTILRQHLSKRFKDGFFTGIPRYAIGYADGVVKEEPVEVIIEFDQKLALFEAPPVAPPIAPPTKIVKQQKDKDIFAILLSSINTPGLDFSVKTINLLKKMGLEYVWQLVVVSKDALTYYKGFGSKSLDDVRRCLAAKGIFPDLAYRLRTLLISDLKVPLGDDWKNDLAVITAHSHLHRMVQSLLASKIDEIIP